METGDKDRPKAPVTVSRFLQLPTNYSELKIAIISWVRLAIKIITE